MFKFRKETMSVRDFLLMFGDIDTQPVGQRLDRDPVMIGRSKPSKAQGILNSMLMGIDVGQITIHETPEGDFKFESIDGGHRKRYIKAFFENRFPDFKTGKYFRDFDSAERDAFLNTDLTFCIYENLEGWQVGYIFRSLNETTQVNHQEMLNSYGSTPVANAIRETVRVVPGVSNSIHPLFDYTQKDGEAKKSFTKVLFDNTGLRIDEMVARLFFRYYDGGGLNTSTDKDLEDMYEADITQDKMDKISEKVHNNLDFVLKMADIRKKRFNSQNMPQKEFTLFYRLWLYMEETYGSFKISDYDQFFDVVYKAYAPFKIKYDQQPKRLQALSPFDSTKTIGKQFNDSLGEFDSRAHVIYPVELLLEDINLESIITVKDKLRSFPLEWREAKLAEQDFKCAVDGKPLTLESAEGGHIIAHTDGGKTTYENLAMISGYHNKKMGSLSITQYKELLGV
jgi:hypothetical protein